MSFPGGIQFTNSGFLLSSKTLIGKQVVFTRLAVGDGELGGQSPLELTGLIHEVETIEINKLQVMSDTEAVVGGPFTNQGLATGFWWREIGLYATDPDTLAEKLYCYGNAGALADYIPAGGGAEILEKQTDIWIMASATANIAAEINSSLVYASAQDLTDHVGDGAAHGATVAATGGKIMLRDANGRAKVADPIDNLDAVNKQTLTTAMALAIPKGTNSSGTDAYVLTLSGITAYTDNLLVLMRTSIANTGPASLEINGLGAKPIRTFKAGVDADISTGEIPANSQVLLCYSSTAVSGAGGFVSLNIRDADLLDGQHGSYYMPAASAAGFAKTAGYKTAAEINAHTLETGFYEVTDTVAATLGLPTSYYHIMNMHHIDNNGFTTQIAYPLNNATGEVYIRYSAGTTWGSWKKIWTSDNLRATNGYLEYLSGGAWTPVGLIITKPRTADIKQNPATQNTWYPLVNATGKGELSRVEVIAYLTSTFASATDSEIQLIVDGVTNTLPSADIASGEQYTRGASMLHSSSGGTRSSVFSYLQTTTFLSSLQVNVRCVASGVTWLNASADFGLV